MGAPAQLGPHCSTVQIRDCTLSIRSSSAPCSHHKWGLGTGVGHRTIGQREFGEIILIAGSGSIADEIDGEVLFALHGPDDIEAARVPCDKTVTAV